MDKVKSQVGRMIRAACRVCTESTCRGCRFPRAAHEIGLEDYGQKMRVK